MIVEIQVVKHAQTHAKHFFRFQQMTDIRSAVTAACRTLTALFNRSVIQFIFGIKKIQLAMISVDMAVTSVTAGIYTIKEIHTTIYRFQNICRSSNSHQIGRLLNRQIRNHCLNNPVHLLMTLSYRQSADRISRKIKFRDLFCMLNTDVFKNRSLIDSKEQLIFINRIFQTVQTIHLCLTSFQPANRAVYRILHVLSVCQTGRAFIKSHGNGGSQI